MKALDFTGRGGTRIEPVMEWAREHRPDVVAIFTDGHFAPATFDPKVPVLWVVHNNVHFSAPFGRIVHCTI